MPRSVVHSRPAADRTGLYHEITSKIIAELEAGRLPWVQPWGASAVQAPLAMPRNASTRRAYSGVNVLILWGAVVQHGFSGQGWLTFRQVLGLGGHVRRGERGTTVRGLLRGRPHPALGGLGRACRCRAGGGARACRPARGG